MTPAALRHGLLAAAFATLVTISAAKAAPADDLPHPPPLPVAPKGSSAPAPPSAQPVPAPAAPPRTVPAPVAPPRTVPAPVAPPRTAPAPVAPPRTASPPKAAPPPSAPAAEPPAAPPARGPVPWPTVDAPGPAPRPAPPPPRVPPPPAPEPAPSSPPARAPTPFAPPLPAPTQGPAPWVAAPAPVGPPALPPVPSPPAVSPLPPAEARAETSGGAYGQFSLFVDRDRELTGQIPAAGAWLSHRPAHWVRIYAGAEVAYLDELRMEQAFLELAPSSASRDAMPVFGLRAGLLLLPLGIINQWHMPTTYLTVDRPLTDQLIIPTTWREIGLEIFGGLGEVARYQVQLVAGLDAAGFSAVAPLRGGRGNAGGIGAHDAVGVARLEFGGLRSGFAIGAGGYWGGVSGGHAELEGVKVGLAEVDLRYSGGGFDLRAEAAELFIVNSYQVNDYLGLLGQDAVPARGRGFYGQIGYDVLYAGDDGSRRPSLLFFAGFENVNPRSQMSRYNFNPASITGPGESAPNAPSPARSFARGGIVYRPIPSIAIKADGQFALQDELPAPLPPVTTPNAPGRPVPVPDAVSEAARGRTRVGFALAFSF